METGCLPEARRGNAGRLLARRTQCGYDASEGQPDCGRAACLVGVNQSKGIYCLNHGRLPVATAWL